MWILCGEQFAVLAEAANEVGLVVHDDYSGRNMFGRRCVALSGPTVNLMAVALELTCREAEGGREVLEALAQSASFSDSLGRGMVVYWPSVVEEQHQ